MVLICRSLFERTIVGIKDLGKIIYDIEKADSQLFRVKKINSDMSIVGCTSLGRRLCNVIDMIDLECINSLTKYKLNPYLNLYVHCRNEVYLPFCISEVSHHAPFYYVNDMVQSLNQLVVALRTGAKSHTFKSEVRRVQQTQNKRKRSCNLFINRLFENHSRLLVLRLDLTYKTAHSQENVEEYKEYAKQDWEDFIKDLRNGYPITGLIGYIVKTEYGLLKGLHHHVLLFYSGAQYREDQTLASIICKHWRDKITEQRGSFYNCHLNKNKYLNLGIGIINHFDSEKINSLKTFVGGYLTKPDYLVELTNSQSFRKSNLPSIKNIRSGRPRK